MSAKTEEILESLKSLSLLEASELVKQIEDAFGVSAAASAGGVMAAPGAAGGDADGGAVKAIQSFQKDTKKSETKGALFEGRLLSDSEIKEIASLPSKEVLMAKIAGALNGVATKIAISINEVPSGLARSLKQLSLIHI